MSGANGRDNRQLQFVREFASVISVLQVGSCVAHLRFSDGRGRYNNTIDLRHLTRSKRPVDMLVYL